MAIQIGTDPDSGQATVTFSISGTDAAAVPVVGSFNDWTPGRHTGPSKGCRSAKQTA
jgi:hypothetical protein